MAFENGRQLKEDVLFRAGEPTTGSQWDTKAVEYLNRSYRTLASGASEFVPEYIEDWWWLRDRDVLSLDPVVEGQVSVTQGSESITFDEAPSISLAGRRLRLNKRHGKHHDIFLIESHDADSTDATLDMGYTGPTASSLSYEAMKVEYSLDNKVSSILSPIIGYERGIKRIHGLSPERMDVLQPLAKLEPGAPKAFSLEDERTVRFSHGGRDDGNSMRVEYRFRPVVDDLTDSVDSEPLVPLKWRHVLADMALSYMMVDKNDDRVDSIAKSARNGLAAMLKENRRRLAKMDGKAAFIIPRAGHVEDKLLRTESGLIVE